MENKLSPYAFFRTFDIAFFVPGVVVVLAIDYSLRQVGIVGVADFLRSDGLVDSGAISVRAIAQGLSMLVVVYVAGLACHSITWGLVQWRRKEHSSFVQDPGSSRLIGQFIDGTIQASPNETSRGSTHGTPNSIARNLKRLLDHQREQAVEKNLADFRVKYQSPQSGTTRRARIWNWCKARCVGDPRELAYKRLVNSLDDLDPVCRHDENLCWTNDKNQVSEFMSYFWYLRSTCWNLATAFILAAALNGAILMGYKSHLRNDNNGTATVDSISNSIAGGGSVTGRLLIMMSLAILFWILGRAYDRSYARRQKMIRIISHHENLAKTNTAGNVMQNVHP